MQPRPLLPSRPHLLALILAALSGVPAAGEERAPSTAPAVKTPPANVPPPAKQKGGKGKPAGEGFSLHPVKAGPFVVRVKVSGTVESTRATPVELDLKRWADLTVVKAAPHGTAVKAGDVILELETRELSRKIGDLERELPAKELELAAIELDLDKAEKTTPLALEKALREKVQAEQDLAHFEDRARPMQERSAREDVNEVTQSLAYAREELDQLRKMYEKDDLTEETEEIILRRAENTVSRYQWMLEQTQARSERTLNTLLPREHESLRRGLELRQIEWRAGEKALRDGLEKQRLAAAGKRRELEELRRSLAEHQADLAAMRVTAPHDGIVYYGMSQRAKWTTANLVDRKLVPGGKLAMREIAMTVVDPSRWRVLLSLTEEQLGDLAEGQTGTASLKSRPGVKFAGRLESILHVPYHDRTFDAVFAVKVPKEAPPVLPGMTAEAEIVVHEKPGALLVPAAALTKEGEKASLTLSDGKRVPVKTGRSEGDRVEIVEGIKEGAVIRVPRDAPSPAKPGTPQPGAAAKP